MEVSDKLIELCKTTTHFVELRGTQAFHARWAHFKDVNDEGTPCVLVWWNFWADLLIHILQTKSLVDFFPFHTFKSSIPARPHNFL